jgi:hypothetical protein
MRGAGAIHPRTLLKEEDVSLYGCHRSAADKQG